MRAYGSEQSIRRCTSRWAVCCISEMWGEMSSCHQDDHFGQNFICLSVCILAKEWARIISQLFGFARTVINTNISENPTMPSILRDDSINCCRTTVIQHASILIRIDINFRYFWAIQHILKYSGCWSSDPYQNDSTSPEIRTPSTHASENRYLTPDAETSRKHLIRTLTLCLASNY